MLIIRNSTHAGIIERERETVNVVALLVRAPKLEYSVPGSVSIRRVGRYSQVFPFPRSIFEGMFIFYLCKVA